MGFTGEMVKESNKSYDVAINNEKTLLFYFLIKFSGTDLFLKKKKKKKKEKTCIFSLKKRKKKKKKKRRRENSICNNREEPFHNKEIFFVWTGIIDGVGPLYSGSLDISSSIKKFNVNCEKGGFFSTTTSFKSSWVTFPHFSSVHCKYYW